MTTVKLYDDHPYETTFTAMVISVTPSEDSDAVSVILDQTLFFPEEGGQTPDRGTLAGCPVTDVQIDSNGVITHTLQPASEERSALLQRLQPGQQVTGVIDWEHRYSNMQNHSGEHVLSGLLHSLYGYENVGFHLSDNTVTLDTSGQLSREQILDLEQRANAVIWQNVPITCEYPPPEKLKTLAYRSKKEISGPVRIVTIEGVDVCACCAPHVRRTGEIGQIRILNVVHAKDSMRLTILCGKRALLEEEQQQAQLEEVSHLTNYPQAKAGAGVQKLLDEMQALREQLKEEQAAGLDAKLREQQAAAAALSPDVLAGRSIWIFEGPMDNLLQRRYMNGLCDLGYRFAGVFCGSNTEGWKYLIGSRADNANTPNAVLREQFHARGGGKAEMVQGSVAATREQIRGALENLQTAEGNL